MGCLKQAATDTRGAGSGPGQPVEDTAEQWTNTEAAETLALCRSIGHAPSECLHPGHMAEAMTDADLG